MPATAKKKYSSKWFRVALEGATTDGRVISRQWIEEMAKNYDRNLYGARVNCEHIKSLMPDSVFGSYGDVLALKAEEAEVGGKKKLGLFAQIEPNESGLALNQKGQKIYTSAEVNPKFADTGEAYLVGLALTDGPASLGTQALEFSAQHGTLNNRKQDADNLFTACEEITLEFDEITDQPTPTAGLFNTVKALLGKFKEKDGKDATLFAELGQSLEAIAEHVAEQTQALSQAQTEAVSLKAAHEQLANEFAELKTQLEQTPTFSQKRPPVTGGEGTIKTLC